MVTNLKKKKTKKKHERFASTNRNCFEKHLLHVRRVVYTTYRNRTQLLKKRTTSNKNIVFISDLVEYNHS